EQGVIPDPHQPTPGSPADQTPESAAPEVERQRVAARSRVLVDDHHFRAVYRGERRRDDYALAGRDIGEHRAVAHYEDLDGHVAPVIEALVHDHRLTIELGEVIPVEVGIAAGVG